MSDREVDSKGNCSKCGGKHYGSYMCPMTQFVPFHGDCQEASASPGTGAVRLLVRVLPVTYILTLDRDIWESLTEADRDAIVYDATEENCKFETQYEVLP